MTTTRRGFLTRIAAAVVAAPIVAQAASQPVQADVVTPDASDVQTLWEQSEKGMATWDALMEKRCSVDDSHEIRARVDAYWNSPDGRDEMARLCARYRGEPVTLGNLSTDVLTVTGTPTFSGNVSAVGYFKLTMNGQPYRVPYFNS